VTQTELKLFQYATKAPRHNAGDRRRSKGPYRAFDRNVSDVLFSSDSKSILFIADDDGTRTFAASPSPAARSPARSEVA